jgi:hypothetical protein
MVCLLCELCSPEYCSLITTQLPLLITRISRPPNEALQELTCTVCSTLHLLASRGASMVPFAAAAAVLLVYKEVPEEHGIAELCVAAARLVAAVVVVAAVAVVAALGVAAFRCRCFCFLVVFAVVARHTAVRTLVGPDPVLDCRCSCL